MRYMLNRIINKAKRITRKTRDYRLFTNTDADYSARFNYLLKVVRKHNFEMYNRNLFWLDDVDTLNVWREFKPDMKRIKDRHYILYSIAQSLSNVVGDTVECGVFEGSGSFLICHANRNKPNYLHHVFDSFEGLSNPQAADIPVDKTAYKWNKNDLAVPLEVVKRNLSQFDFVQYYQGWIPSRFQEVTERRFSLVHIDVDLYQPTYDSLQFFYPRMVEGGIILCDDYGSTICPGAKQAFDEFIREKPERSVIHLTTGQGFIVKRN